MKKEGTDMKVTMFASIEIASYEISMKIYALSQKSMKEITYVRHRIELGKDAYRLEKISNERIDELCEVLQDFKRIMKEYGATEYRACATAVIRELESSSLLLDRIYVKTGIQLELLSN